ncbi:Mov34/MPN/PAD-1 family protein [Paenibacillus paeoniae]|uniref:JAB domain-containing protein n=1 Tax=Paenibacillus paeoniae TaxID=2292705 RepID=A0A371PMP2_9BACL|nr:M67 family metallopeptidase [Paenibacillus paeoniae]REK77466.1 hypothetical protein DX130_10845 [Paenibacillus paeoniae]
MAETSLNNIQMTIKAYEELLAICARLYPHEACGVLAQSEFSESVDLVLPIQNVHDHPENFFSFHPREWTHTFFGMQKNRQQLAGFFHSHPHSEALPSLSDYDGFVPLTGMTYWIVSLQEADSPSVQPYQMRDGQLKSLPLVLA